MPSIILEELYKQANSNLSKTSLKFIKTKNHIESICRCNVNKAPIRFLMSCLLAKIVNKNVDIRKPYTEIKGDDTYSGRFYDEKYIGVFIQKYKLPCNPTTAYLTPAFRNLDRILTKDLILVGRPKEIYESVLSVLDIVYMKKEKPKNVLREIIRFLLIIKSEDELRMNQLLVELKQTSDMLPLASEDIVTLLSQHLNCKHSSRLPVLIIASAYQAVKEQIGEVNKILKSHTAADKQTGSIGDVEIVLTNEEKVITCYEMKDKRITKYDIDVAIQKITKVNNKLDNYIFISTFTFLS
jgi:DNA adenine methylase